ncbi:glycosyltransferase family 87 protein [Actinoplanes sp. NPDC051851]|uniref:glycosyltransferase family 87 protein n=1 Tax=Actinoplanes sp. NPDC051851 TaxID=3154753 RepID=UPI003437D4D5
MESTHRRALTLLLVTLAAILAASEVGRVLQVLAMGIDFAPLRNAATDLLHGDPVFSDPLFVYPPTAVLLLLPTALGSPYAAFGWYIAAGVAALLLAAHLIARSAPPARRTVFAGASVLALLGGIAAARSLSLGNVTVFLAPVAVGTLLAFHRRRWTLGCALLAASLLVKPLLAPLILVPLLHRRWSALTRTMLPAAAVLLLGIWLIPGGSSYPAVFRYTLSGTNLHGENAVNNLSLRGWSEAHSLPPTAGFLAAGMAAALLFLRVFSAFRPLPVPFSRPLPASFSGPRPGPDPVWLGTTLLVGTLVAGGISEIHYLLVALAATLLLLALRPAPDRVWRLFLLAITLLSVPGPYVELLVGRSAPAQSWFVLAELLLFTALLATPSSPTATTPLPAPPAGTHGGGPASETGAPAGRAGSGGKPATHGARLVERALRGRRLIAAGAAAGLGLAIPVSPPDLVDFAEAGRRLLAGHLDGIYTGGWNQAGPLQLVVSRLLLAGGSDGTPSAPVVAAINVALTLGAMALCRSPGTGRSAAGTGRSAAGQSAAGTGREQDRRRRAVTEAAVGALVLLWLAAPLPWNGHPTEILVPGLWAYAIRLHQRDRLAAATIALGMAVAIAPWAVLGFPCLLAGTAGRNGRAEWTGTVGVALMAGVLGAAVYLPFALAGDFGMFGHVWPVTEGSLLRLVAPGLDTVTWPIRVAQAIVVGGATAWVASRYRENRLVVAAAPATAALLRVLTDPVVLRYYWAPVAVTTVLMIAVAGTRRLALLLGYAALLAASASQPVLGAAFCLCTLPALLHTTRSGDSRRTAANAMNPL